MSILCRPPRRPPRPVEARPPRRLRRAADRRAYERICRQLRPAAGVADRLPGLGRVGGGAARGGGDLHRRALHHPGPPAGRRRPSGAISRCRETSIAEWLKEHAPDGARIGYDPWLHSRDWVKAATRSARGQGRRAGRGRAQSDRRGVGRPPRAVEGAAGRPARGTGRQVVGREAPRHGRLAGRGRRRRGGARGARFDRLDLQRARRRRHATRRSRWPMRVVNADGTADLFVEGEKVGDDVRAHLGNGVRLHERDEFEALSARRSRARRSRSIRSGRWRRSPRRWRRRGDDPRRARPGGAAQGDQE